MLMENDKNENWHFFRRILYDLSVIIISVGVLYVAAVVYAGDLIPPGPVASTLNSLSSIYDVLTGNYDSTGVTPDNNGNVIQILKCITGKINGNPC